MLLKDERRCARIGHDWLPWSRSIVHHDLSRFVQGNVPYDAIAHTRSTRRCYQCGKEQVDL